MMVMSVESVCGELGLNNIQCSILRQRLTELCAGAGVKPKRRLSRWQECITARRKGKGFDPQAIKELAKEYHAGRCP